MIRILCASLIPVFAFAAELKVGQPLTLKKAVSIEQLTSKPENYVGKTVQVKGRITEVCQAMGCWIMLTNDSGAAIRIQVEHGVIEFPKNAAGRTAIAEGVFAKFVLTKEETIAAAQHEAEEQGRSFNPASIKSGKTIYEIEGSGAVLFD